MAKTHLSNERLINTTGQAQSPMTNQHRTSPRARLIDTISQTHLDMSLYNLQRLAPEYAIAHRTRGIFRRLALDVVT